MGAGGYANIIGGVLQSLAATNAQRAMYRAFESEMARQGQYRGQAVTSMNQYLPTLGSEQAGQDMAQGVTRRENAYATGRDQSLRQGAEHTSRDDAYYDLTGHNRARMAAYGDWGLAQGIRGGREAQTLDKITNFAQGDSSVFPYRMYKAQHSMDQLAFFGQLISSLGGGSTSMGQNMSQPPQGGQSPSGPYPREQMYGQPVGPYMEGGQMYQQPIGPNNYLGGFAEG
jgi:hypothetical protein